jgi:LPXTG-motif cell wall-anchored protein
MSKKINTLLAIAALFLVVPVKAATAANFTLAPPSGSYQVSEDFPVDLGIVSGTEKVMSADIVGTFDASKMELKSAVVTDTINFSSEIAANIDNTAGTFTLMLVSSKMDPYQSAVINGPVVKLTFMGKTAGTGTVNFTCSGTSYEDSNIFNPDNADVIVCGSNQSGSYTFTGVGGDDTVVDDPAPTDAVVAATGETELPKTGSASTILGLMIFGLVGIGGAFMLRFL